MPSILALVLACAPDGATADTGAAKGGTGAAPAGWERVECEYLSDGPRSAGYYVPVELVEGAPPPLVAWAGGDEGEAWSAVATLHYTDGWVLVESDVDYTSPRCVAWVGRP